MAKPIQYCKAKSSKNNFLKKNKKIKKFIKLGNQQHQKIKLSPSQYLKKVNSKMQLRQSRNVMKDLEMDKHMSDSAV